MISNSTLIILRSSPSFNKSFVNVPKNLINGLGTPKSIARSTVRSKRTNDIIIINKTGDTNILKSLINKLIDRLVSLSECPYQE